jgi:hypothetical protein
LKADLPTWKHNANIALLQKAKKHNERKVIVAAPPKLRCTRFRLLKTKSYPAGLNLDIAAHIVERRARCRLTIGFPSVGVDLTCLATCFLLVNRVIPASRTLIPSLGIDHSHVFRQEDGTRSGGSWLLAVAAQRRSRSFDALPRQH